MRALVIVSFAFVLAACPPPIDENPPPPQTVVLGGPAVFQDPGAFTATAQFSDEPSARCTFEDAAGACTFAVCAAGEAPVAPGPSLDAGAIELSTETGGDVSLSRGDDGLYGTETGEVFFQNREELAVEVAGGADVPAFSFTLFAPTRLQLTDPPLAAVNTRVVDPIEVAWSNDSEGFVEVVLRDQGGSREAVCKGAASAGALQIPAQIVGHFPLGQGTLDVTVFNEASTEVEPLRVVRFEARTHATAPTGGNATYNVTFAAP